MPAFPQNVNWGHLGVRSIAQFAQMSPVTYAMQQVAVDQNDGTVISYLSNGTTWLTLPGGGGVFIGDFTWEARPTTGLIVGNTARFINIGLGGAYGWWDGLDWYPIGDWVFYDLSSAKTITGVPNVGVSGNFTGIAPGLAVTVNTAFAPTGGPFTIPANVLSSRRRLYVWSAVHRRNNVSPSAATNRVYLGTAGNLTDSLLAAGSLSNTDGRQSALTPSVWFPTSTTAVDNALVSTGTNLIDVVSTNINTAAIMYVTFAVQHDNASDEFSLPRVKIWVSGN